MSKRSNLTAEEAFEKIYKTYYVDVLQIIHDQLKKGKEIYPSFERREKIISEALNINCAFRFIDILNEDKITKLCEEDKKFPFSFPIDNKTFFKLIHPAYLIPYLVYAEFGYRLAYTVKATCEDLLALEYQVPLPIRFRNEKDYTWYMQKSRVLSLNENNQVISHINTYHIQQKFIPSVDKEIRFIGATVLQDERIHERFQEELRIKLTEYFQKHLFHEQHWRVIKYQTGKSKKTKYKKSYINDLNKEIKKLIEVQTGYPFKNIKAIISYLRILKVLK